MHVQAVVNRKRQLSALLLAAQSVFACSFFAPTLEEYARGIGGGGGDAGMMSSGGIAGDAGALGNGGALANGGAATAGQGSSCLSGSTCDAGAGAESMGAAGEAGASGANPAPSGPLADGLYRVVSVNSSKCIDASGTFSTAGTVVTSMLQEPCATRTQQSFIVTAVGAGYSTLSLTGSKQCIDLESATAAVGTPLILAECSGSPSQQWFFVPQAGGTVLLVNRATGNCADVTGDNTSDGVVIEQWGCQASDNQRWRMASLTPQPVPLVVDDFFVSPAYWGSANNGNASMTPTSSSDTQDCNGNRAPNALGACHIVSFLTLPTDNTVLGGSNWLYPVGNYGTVPGLLVALGATKVHFQARGDKGGEIIGTLAGGEQGGVFQDKFSVPRLSIVLTAKWQSYALNLTGLNYSSGVVCAFQWSLTSAGNTAPVKFYIDDIVWE